MLEVEGEREEKEEKKRNIKKEYLNKMGKKIEFWNIGCIEKWYGINDKVAFWDGKIGWDEIFDCGCSKSNK